MDTVFQQSPIAGTTNGTVYLTTTNSPRTGPLVAVAPDIRDGKVRVAEAVLNAVLEAGGVPVVLSHDAGAARRVLASCAGLVLIGGDDPRMEAFGVETHAESVLVHPARQLLDLTLLEAINETPELPVLAICLGMQYMGLAAGGQLQQHLPDVLDDPSMHLGNTQHTVEGDLGAGTVCSHHRQALDAAGRLDIVARAPDGVIEAVRDPERAWTVGVQWHPERMTDGTLGPGLFNALVEHAGAYVS